MSRRKHRTAPGTLIVGVVALVALGLLAGVLLVKVPAPQALAQPHDPTSIKTVAETFDDSRQVTPSFESAPAQPLQFGTAGKLVSSNCTPGATISSGQKIAEVDGSAVLALHTTQPLWRDLSSGTHGDDVRALDTELSRLGYRITVSDKYTATTQTVVNKLLHAAGITVPKGTNALQVATIVWLGTPTVTVLDCPTPVGTNVAPGSTFATLPSTLTKVTLKDAPKDALPGDRILDLGSVQAPTAANGDITDAAVLGQIAASPEYAQLAAATKDDPSQQATLNWHLATPISATGVPPKALFGTQGQQACVRSGNHNYKVTVISSSLGTTLVTFGPGITPPTRVDLNPGDRACT